MRTAICILLLALAAGCKAKRGDDGKPAGGAEGATVAVPARAEGAPVPVPRRTTAVCPECGGTGGCARCGDERVCLLCDGGGRCAICGGTGRDRDGSCAACDGGGACPDCRGDGILSRAAQEIGLEGAPLPGQCPLCWFGTGLCADCGGSGSRPDGEACDLCGGAKWCPECRGAGTDPWCAGAGACPACGGHGQVVGGRPGQGWPPVRLVLRTGEIVVGDLLERPGASVAVERERSGRLAQESFVEKNVDPVSYLAALRRYVDPASAADRLEAGEYALRQGPELLFAARADLAAAERGEATAGRAAALRRDAEERIRGELVRLAKDALAGGKDVRAALRLATLSGLAFGGATPDAGASVRREASALLAAEEEGLSAAVRERKRAAEAERLARAVRRAEGWRARAEGLLARTDADGATFLRALRASDRATRDARGAAGMTPPGVPRAAAHREGEQASRVAVRAVVGLAARVLDAGRADRARSLAVIALTRDPGDAGALRFAAVVEEFLAREGVRREEDR